MNNIPVEVVAKKLEREVFTLINSEYDNTYGYIRSSSSERSSSPSARSSSSSGSSFSFNTPQEQRSRSRSLSLPTTPHGTPDSPLNIYREMSPLHLEVGEIATGTPVSSTHHGGRRAGPAELSYDSSSKRRDEF